jgi:predicted small lipoprotein YifL
LARKLIANGEKGHRLNFPDDDIEVWGNRRCNYFGVSYNKEQNRWRAERWSKKENRSIYVGTFKDAETAIRASDTLGKTLIANGEKGHKLNFPDDDKLNFPKDDTEVWKNRRSKYFGVCYNNKQGGARREMEQTREQECLQRNLQT